MQVAHPSLFLILSIQSFNAQRALKLFTPQGRGKVFGVASIIAIAFAAL
jgi:hypothetical protein